MLTSEKVAAALDVATARGWALTVASFMDDGDIDPELRRHALFYARNMALEGRESVRLQILAFMREHSPLNISDDFGLPTLLMLTWPSWADTTGETLQ